MNFPSLKELGGKAKSAFARFPITLLWSLIGSFYCIIVVEQDILQGMGNPKACAQSNRDYIKKLGL